MQIKDAVTVVTGAASGIGLAVCRELAERGAKHVAMVDLQDTVEERARELGRESPGTEVKAFRGDVTVNICVPAAGIVRDALSVKIDRATGKARLYPIDTFRMVTEINYIAPIYWAMEMVGRMAEHRFGQGLCRWQGEEELHGAVIFVGSVASRGNKGQISYASAKAGLEGAAATLMKEAIFHGVRCGVIHPGFTDTPILRAMGEEYLREHVLPETQIGRLIRPEEIADAICFMISNPAVSGALWADAGWHPSAA